MLVVIAIVLLSVSTTQIADATLLGPPCACDCSLNGPIEVSDLVLLVNANLGRVSVSSCPSYLDPGPPSVSVLVQCVGALLQREVCPLSVRSPTPTPRPRPTPTGTLFPPADAAAAESATRLLESIFVCATGATPGGFVAVYREPAGAFLECGSFTGHNGSFSLLKYPSASEAEDAFGVPSAEETVEEITGGVLREARWNPFCGSPESTTCSRPDAVSTAWAWRRDCWVATGETFDDTGFILTPQGMKVATAFGQSPTLGALLGLCSD